MKKLLYSIAVVSTIIAAAFIGMNTAAALGVGDKLIDLPIESADKHKVVDCNGYVFDLYVYKGDKKRKTILALRTNKGTFAFIVLSGTGRDVIVFDADYDGKADTLGVINAAVFLGGCYDLSGA